MGFGEGAITTRVARAQLHRVHRGVYHSSRAAFERDRRRDAELAADGWRVIRVTWRQLVNEPEAVVATLSAALARAAAAWQPSGGGPTATSALGP